ncbi:spore protease YyaC [Fuchsiella alkaliacetigena]|uniref:spore protease YyaC n=1 Tax=Fuchsiella alkaliacetigena TaxID=957042 RepID=UPI00200ADC32|nr:spore protease YyaC [Fuchsiella alkaliacetigena]MCK8824544.1 spore protease YyaC [Fuchsiella alkaliacetigena]
MGSFESIICKNCGKQVMDLEFFLDTPTTCSQCNDPTQEITTTQAEVDFDRDALLDKNKVHIDDPWAANNLKKLIVSFLEQLFDNRYQEIVILCIGTDRSTGDSLGPLIGNNLNKSISAKVPVFGTLNNPVHATNLKEKLKLIKEKYPNPFILAIDAGLGRNSSVGSISVEQGPLKPGSGVNKELPPVGDMHITGLVNIGGYMEYFVLQSTRLSLVFKMAKVISRGINWGLRNLNYI